MKKINVFLKKLEEKNGNFSSLGEKVVKVVAIIVSTIILIVFLQIIAFFGIFNWVGSEVRALTGLDEFLAKGFALILMALFFGTPIGGMVWSFLPIPQKNRKRKRFIFLGLLSLLFFISFFVSRNVYFNSNTGEAMKYYSIGIDGGYKFYSSGGYDPVTGDELQKVDRETIEKYLIGSDYKQKIVGGDLIGAERNSKFYYVKFKNKTDRNIYLCISFSPLSYESTIIKFIGAGESPKVRLMEGRHIFAYMDVNGNSYGGREEIGGDYDNYKILTKSNNIINIEVNNKNYSLNKTFSLDVLASDDQIITLKDDAVKDNKELNGDEITVLIISFLLGISLLVFLFCTITPSNIVIK